MPPKGKAKRSSSKAALPSSNGRKRAARRALPDELISRLSELRDRAKAARMVNFFKTGPGSYGESDEFWGISVPDCRSICRAFCFALSLDDLRVLLEHAVHEVRAVAVFALVYQYEEAVAVDPQARKAEDSSFPLPSPQPDSCGSDDKRDVVDFYLEMLHRVNSWDLVDSSSAKILGHYVFNFDTPDRLGSPGAYAGKMIELARSPDMWKRRASVVATHYLIRKKRFDETLQICKILLHDQEDLVRKACGWMLREVGKQDVGAEVSFLNSYAAEMPRLMLRFAVSKFPPELRSKFQLWTR